MITIHWILSPLILTVNGVDPYNTSNGLSICLLVRLTAVEKSAGKDNIYGKNKNKEMTSQVNNSKMSSF